MSNVLNVFKLPVFEVADVFPMLGAEELQELADDIKANGLHEPLVVAELEDGWTLIDGRNPSLMTARPAGRSCELGELLPSWGYCLSSGRDG